MNFQLLVETKVFRFFLHIYFFHITSILMFVCIKTKNTVLKVKITSANDRSTKNVMRPLFQFL